MTRSDYWKIAKVFRDAKPVIFTEYIGIPATDAIRESINYGAHAQWAADVIRISDMLKADNPRFNETIFLRACGEEIRPDGAMYVVDWENSRIA